MMAAVNTEFGEELKKYGAYNFNACYNCGNCTAVCSLSSEENSFPREMVRLSVLGRHEDIKSSIKPWLCYYCGECSTHCPQDANPGELMMSLRRWLTAQYDWTKLSGLLYRSLPVTLISFILAAAGVLVFCIYRDFDLEAIMYSGHIFEMAAIAGVFGIILLPNIIRMWWFIIIRTSTSVSLSAYISETYGLIMHMFTQRRSLDCEDNQFRWLEHFVLVIGYLGLLLLTVVFDWFSSESMFIIVFGYLLSLVVFMVTIDFVFERLRRVRETSKFSQPSDWLFVVWLFLMGLSAFTVRLFIDLGLLESNRWVYFMHLIILVQWALLIVPFGKWTHFLYRSFAMYFERLKVR